jgi:hypothetical protein
LIYDGCIGGTLITSTMLSQLGISTNEFRILEQIGWD